MSDVEPLDGFLAELVDAERAAPPLAPSRKEAIFARVAESLPVHAAPSTAPPAPSTATAAPPSTAPASTGALSLFKGKLVPLACLALGVAAGALGQRALDGPAQPTVERVEIVARVDARASSAAPSTTATFAPAASTPAAVAPIAARPPIASPVRGRGASTSSVARAAAGDLERERLMLGAARTAIRRGDVAGALGVLGEHARAFPDGQLAAERDVLLEQVSKLPAPAIAPPAPPKTIP